MEHQILASARERLIPGLEYSPGALTAQYVQKREATTFCPSGANQYSVNGVRVLRFELTTGGDAFVDPSTVRLAFTLKNLSAVRHLQLLSDSPLCSFQRLPVLAKGQLFEDISYLHRLEQMFDILLPLQRRKTQSLMMIGDDGPGEEFNIKTESIAPKRAAQGDVSSRQRTPFREPSSLDSVENDAFDD